MESLSSAGFDIFEIYHRYCDFMSAAYAYGNGDCLLDKESQNGKFSRESLNQLLKMVESRSWTRISVFEEIYKLMMRLNVMVNTSEFSRFYDFVFLICRENGQKNISVGRAVMAWRLVLAGRFPLLNEWCDYVEKNQRHNISEDTWRQLLAFSRCVKANLEGYDPEGAWPVLIDDFVEHMYRCRSYTDTFNSCCKCGDLDGQPLEVSAPGVDSPNLPGLKRKFDELEEQNQSLNGLDSYNSGMSNKREIYREDYPCDSDDSMEAVKQCSPWGCSPSPCHVEGCLSKGFAGLFSTRSRMRC